MDHIKMYNDYINGNMPEDQAEDFTKMLLKDYFEAEDRKAKWNGLLEKNTEFQQLKKEFPNKNNTGRRFLFFAAIAASFLVLIMALGNFLSFGNQQDNPIASAVDKHLEQHFEHNNYRKGGGIQALRLEASSHYNDRKFKKATDLYQQILNSKASDAEALFYQGLCFLYQNKDKAAIRNFDKLLSKNENAFYHETRWFISLALIKDGQQELARTHLEELVKITKWKKQEAEELIRAIQQ